jgi:hypothetical protein
VRGCRPARDAQYWLGSNIVGGALRAALESFVSRRDGELFGLDAVSPDGLSATDRRPRLRTTGPASSEVAETPASV